MTNEVFNGVAAFHAQDREAWRSWLEQHHDQEKSVWLIIYRKQSETPSVYYDEAVDEALCYGWIDSTPRKRDEESYYQFFARRNPKSNWSKVNKEKVERLTAEGRMTASGLASVKLAKETGTWTALDEVENLTIPDDLKAAFNANEQAWNHFDAFSRSSKRGILEWIQNAKRPETRKKRVEQTVALATDNIKSNHPRP
ncbi:hypothetical protein SY83_06135 [Paenibacillus swuensis]|uniref:Bacteriocin-protection protein n=1 Tax=Paenibacillus swuensis TaxID=1178515 RepID=A0A172TFV8_9BACL|nr:YdeI/OmpD-associated family protein [Paenibacillus swuensis]ANE45939.1 hypothetical protein SY83_06135 [Paenibacillus swuensis]